MKSNYYFSVEDILTRKHFEHAKVIAGHKGLKRKVKWVHVVEVTAIRNLLNGNELILSTGLALKEEGTFLSLINQLVDCQAAAICIELDTNISTIPNSVIRCADANDFPIIVFEKEVPFVSITQDIHSVLIHYQYEMVKQLDSYAQQLNKKLLNVNHFREILHVLHKELDVPVFLELKEQNVEIYPPFRRPEEQRLRMCYLRHKKSIDAQFASTKLILFEQEYAELSIYRSSLPFSEYELLLLDRTSTALAQFLMRELYFEEKKRIEESKWIMSWIKGEHSFDRIETYLSDLKINIQGGVVSICQLKRTNENETLDLTYFNLVARSIFEQQGFQVLSEREGNDLIFILLDTRLNKDWKPRIVHAYERIRDSDLFQCNSDIIFSTGKYQKELMNIHNSYQTAKESILYRSKIKDHKGYYFYDDLHLFRLISIVQKNGDLAEMLEECIHPILDYDKEHDGNLLQTLKVYLSCQGSKQETAKRLFIVRQTLYHRLKKIEELLGEHYMTPEKRIALEFMLAAHEYKQSLNFQGCTKVKGVIP
ncbi:PucR family transcriptional regulator [Rossellomorea aquimaris]|uniref:PucR family transcriptional regulator n=1 Tax=Rossellomorea aquimaris TaxID=189382 RepID=UPI0007D05182|nr:PucR family transcriptional regulator [Rossellomorea aquimaris]